MRFSFDIKFLNCDKIKIPVYYRKSILSLFKEGLKHYAPDFYEDLWGNRKKNKNKPFTFSAYIPGASTIEEDKPNFIITDSEYIRVFVSSSDVNLIMQLYNSILNLSGKYSPFNYETRFKHFMLEKDEQINDNEIKFKTFSPVVVRKTENKRGVGYLTPEDSQYIESLKYTIKNLCEHYLNGVSYSIDDFSIDVLSFSISKVPHYDESISAVNGIFKISAPADVLKLIYDCGLGTRRAQGFGMVEVVR